MNMKDLGIVLIAAAMVVRAGTSLGQEHAEPAHFHHVHLNVTDPAKTLSFYKKYFGAVEISYRGKSPALFTERSFILLTKVDSPPPYLPKSALNHIGWATVDADSDYEWLKSQGVEFETPPGSLGANKGMYVYGPDKEMVELWTGSRNHRFEHLHLWATDVEKSAAWFREHLGVQGRVSPQPTLRDSENIGAIRMGFLQSDNVNLVFFGRPDFESRWWPGGSFEAKDGPQGEFEPTRGRAVDHIAFSYRNIEPVYERMRAAGVKIVEPLALSEEYGHRSFFVEGPDKLLIEIVQDKPLPEGIWD